MKKAQGKHSAKINAGLAKYLPPHHLERLKQVTVGIAGAGGLGSNVAVHLVRSGIKRLVIADHDIVEASNLNRQFYFPGQIGMPKVEALRDTLLRLAPDLALTAHVDRLTAIDIGPVFGRCDAVVEAFDDPAAKKMLVEKILPTGRFLVAASGIGGYGEPDTIRIRKIKSGFYMVGDGTTPSTPITPPMSPRVGIAAAMQADLILQYIIGTCTGQEKDREQK